MIEIRSAGVLIKKDKILLANHFKENKSYWVLPGGRLEFGETLNNCLEREIFEESGLKVKVKKFLFFMEIILEKRHILNFFFLVQQKGGRLKKVEEKVLKGVHFVPVKGLKTMDFRPKQLLPFLLKGIKNNFKNCEQKVIASD